MPKTISELEAQRAKILQEIESKAGNISSHSGSESNPSLNDWLNAAEEVMPESDKNAPQATGAGYSSKLLKTSHSNTASTPFFGIIILFTLFLTLVGIIYIAYSTINKDLSNVVTYKEQSTQQINELQTGIESIQKSMATGGKTELFTAMEQEVAELKKEVAFLKAQVADLEAKLDQKASSTEVISENKNEVTAAQTVTASEKQSLASSKSGQVVTEAVLDQKLKLYYQQLESKIDQKIEKVLLHLNGGKGTDQTGKTDVISQASMPETAIAAPTVETVKTPEIAEPELKVTEVAQAPVIEEPAAPAVPDAPKATLTEDSVWLLDQPKKNYTLQLASMPSEASIKRIKEKQNLNDAKIITQTKENASNYILVTGSIKSKTEAQKLAKEIKAKTGISPWVRQIEDIARRVK